MGNKHQSGHNGQQHDHPHSGGRSAGSPLQQQASDQHRFETRVHDQNRSQDVPRGGPQASQSLRSAPARPDRDRSFTTSVLETIKENPIPVALVGLGLGAGVTWLIMSNRQPPASPASRLVHHILQRAEAGGRKLERSIEQITPTSALAIGTAMLTVGAGITLAMLGSRDESSWLSKGREQLVEIAQGFAHDAIERVEAIAKQLTEAYSQHAHAAA